MGKHHCPAQLKDFCKICCRFFSSKVFFHGVAKMGWSRGRSCSWGQKPRNWPNKAVPLWPEAYLDSGVKGGGRGIWESCRKSKRHATMKNSMNHLEIAGGALFIGNYFGFLEGSFRQLHGNSSDDVEWIHEMHDVDLLLMCQRPCKRALHSRWKRILFGWRCDGSRSPLLIPKRSHVCMQIIVASIGLRI